MIFFYPIAKWTRGNIGSLAKINYLNNDIGDTHVYSNQYSQDGDGLFIEELKKLTTSKKCIVLFAGNQSPEGDFLFNEFEIHFSLPYLTCIYNSLFQCLKQINATDFEERTKVLILLHKKLNTEIAPLDIQKNYTNIQDVKYITTSSKFNFDILTLETG